MPKLLSRVLFLMLTLCLLSAPVFATQSSGESAQQMENNIEIKNWPVKPKSLGYGNESFGDTVGVQTTVRVPDQHSAVLGGLKQTEATQEEGVPVLGKIPLLGRLFRSKGEKKEEQTLLILNKPTMVNTDRE